MRKLLVIGFLITSLAAWAQEDEKQSWTIGVHFGSFEYRGDLGSEYFSFSDMHFAPGISLSGEVSPSFDLMGTFSYGIINYSTQRAQRIRSFTTTLYDFNFLAKYKFANGKILKEDFFIRPSIVFGFGDAYSTVDAFAVPVSDQSGMSEQFLAEGNHAHFNFPFGLSIEVPVTEQLAVNLMSITNYIGTDRYDGVVAGEYNDQFIWHSFGVMYKLR